MTVKSHPFLLICTMLLCSAAFIDASEDKDLLFGLSPNPFVLLTSWGGKGTADAREIFEKIANEFKKLHSYNITLKIYTAPKFFFKAIEDKTADLGYMSLPTYLTAKRLNVPVKPLAAASLSSIKAEKYCVYVHKASSIEKIIQLEGKSFVMDFPAFVSRKEDKPVREGYIVWVILKKILQRNGVRETFMDFFGSFKVLSVPPESVAYSVLLKKFDALLSEAGFIRTLQNYDSGFSELRAVACMDAPAGSPFLIRRDLNPELVRFFKNYLLSPPKNSQLAMIMKKEYKGVRIYSVSENDYDEYFTWLREAEQKGWIDEFNEIIKETMVEVKKKKETKKPF